MHLCIKDEQRKRVHYTKFLGVYIFIWKIELEMNCITTKLGKIVNHLQSKYLFRKIMSQNVVLYFLFFLISTIVAYVCAGIYLKQLAYAQNHEYHFAGSCVCVCGGHTVPVCAGHTGSGEWDDLIVV